MQPNTRAGRHSRQYFPTRAAPQRGDMAKEDHAGCLTATMLSPNTYRAISTCVGPDVGATNLCYQIAFGMILSTSKKPHL